MQAVLLGAYTDEYKVSQSLSIASSAFFITKTAIAVLMFKRASSSKGTNTENTLTLQLQNLKHFFLSLPLVLSSLVFQSGTVVLAIMVLEWYSAIYIGAVLVLNLTLSLILPFGAAKSSEDKFKLKYKYSMMNLTEDEKSLRDNRTVRGIFATWANLFLVLRPVENRSYHKITHMGILQPIKFLLNILTLTILIVLTWVPTDGINSNVDRHGSWLIIAYVVVFIAGVFNQLEMICYFYFGNAFWLTKPPVSDIEMSPLKNGKSVANEEDNPTEKTSQEDEEKTRLIEEPSKLLDQMENTLETSQIHLEEASELNGHSNEAEVMEEKEQKEETESKEDDQEFNKLKNEEDKEEKTTEKVEDDSEKLYVDNEHDKTEEQNKTDDSATTKIEESDDTTSLEETEEQNEADESTATKGEESDDTNSLEETEQYEHGYLQNPALSNVKFMSQMSNTSVLSADGSGIFDPDETIQFIEVTPDLPGDFAETHEMVEGTKTEEEVRKIITDIQQGGKVNKEMFIKTMMDFFPRYNLEVNRNKLDKLFDRLDKRDEDLISFR